jgi:uncharacterized protein YxjI
VNSLTHGHLAGSHAARRKQADQVALSDVRLSPGRRVRRALALTSTGGSPLTGEGASPRRLVCSSSMGFFRHGDDIPNGRRFQMHEKLVSIGDDAWIEDEQGDRVYKVDGKALRVRETFILEDRDGNEVAKIQDRKLSIRDTMKIEREGQTVATIRKALVGIRDRFHVEVDGGGELRAHGNVVDHEYKIERDGDVIATVSKKWFRVRDTYGVEIGAGEDEPMLLALTVALDEMSRH